MKKTNWMKGLAVMAMGLATTSCNKADSLSAVTEEVVKENAEAKLGIEIDPGQTWQMTQNVTANIVVNLGLDERYTVAFYDENPFVDDNALFYGETEVKEGAAKTLTMTIPSNIDRLFVATFDSKLRSVVNTVSVENGKIDAIIGEETTKSAHRAQESDYSGSFAKTASDYLKGLTVADMKGYYAITDEIITDYTSNGNHTLTDATWSKGLNGGFIGDGKHFRVAAGTTINESFNLNGTYGVINDVVIYIEGTVHLKGNTMNGPTMVIGSGGKVIIDSYTSFSNNGRFVILPGGEMTGSAGLKIANGSYCYNAGTINTTGELDVNGTDFYNCGTVKVDALNNQSGGIITNFGKMEIRTNNGDSNTYNCTVINGCYMHYKANAGMGTLTLLDNSRLDVDGQVSIAGGVYYGQGAILYDKSEINAGSIFLNGTKFTGPSGSGTYAIVKTGKMLVNEGNDLAAQGNVYFDWNYNTGLYDHNNQRSYNCTEDNGYTYLSVIKQKNLKYTNSNNSALIIPAGDCTGLGNNPSGASSGVIPKNYPVYSYAFEDTRVGDYDMNDVVIKAQETADGKINLKVVACGATMNLNIRLYPAQGTRAANEAAHYQGTPTNLSYNGQEEVHAMLGADAMAMVNTGSTATARPITIQINKGSYDPAHLPLAIYSAQQGEIRLAGSGQAPFGVVIPKDWSWPTERECVTAAYDKTNAYNDDNGNPVNQSFSTFAAVAGAAEKWYNYATGSVMNEGDLGF